MIGNKVVVLNVDNVNVNVYSDDGIAYELNSHFEFKVPGAEFTPAYRARHWDGKIRLFSIKTREIYRGLVPYIEKFCKDRGYPFEYKGADEEEFTVEEAAAFIKKLKLSNGRGEPLEPHDYQVTAFINGVRKKRKLYLSPTSSGKSLISYLLVRYFIEKKLTQGLVVVPTIGLVNQLFSDFKDYSEFNKWDVDKHVHKVYGGQDKKSNKPCIISTWQSIYEEKLPYFKPFLYVIGDEAHLFQAKSLQAIMTKLVNASYRIGMTGTLDDSKTHKLVLEGLFGAVENLITTREMIDRGIASEINIKCIHLKHPKLACQAAKSFTYAQEIEYLVLNEERNKFIAKLAVSLEGNTLLLFQYVEKHGKILHPLIQKLAGKKRKVFFVAGETEAAIREEIRGIVEKEKNAIIVASYGTFSTGINIRNLHNIIFAIGYKSTIRVLQSIGRGLRKHESKEQLTLYDVSDDLTYSKKQNHTLNHFMARIKIYMKEKFKFKIIKIDL